MGQWRMISDPVADTALLRWWLDDATDGLCESATRSIRDEITDHYDDTLSENLKLALAPLLAEQDAVERLGDPRAANLKYKRIHLTERQARVLSGFSEPARVRWWILAAVFLLPSVYEIPQAGVHGMLASSSLVVYTISQYIIFPALVRSRTRRSMILFLFNQAFFPLIASGMMYSSSIPIEARSVLILPLAGLVIQSIVYLPIVRKLLAESNPTGDLGRIR